VSEPFAAIDIIAIKRDGGALLDAQIDWALDAYTRGAMADEQMAALAMAIVFRGMTAAETARWTTAMISSGEVLDLTGVRRPTVDKHSTGGVGDKATLVVAPLVAACGAAVPHLAGRGLGHTGGTLDKLESIPGWRPALPMARIAPQLDRIGAMIAAAGDELAPADRKLYALRDATATVSSIPLIASSIMSKKVAAGAAALVLDVKVGTGALLQSLPDARELARAMVALGADHGRTAVALLTDMSSPLGHTAGNALEVAEAVEVLAGGGPADVIELVLALAREMLLAAGLDADPAAALRDGRAMDVWRAMIAAQGGDPDAPLPQAPHVHVVTAVADGVLSRVDALAVGLCAWRLGAGRARKEDPVSAAAGVRLLAKPGEAVRAGQPLLELHAEDPARFPAAIGVLDGAIDIAQQFRPAPLIIERIDAGSAIE
jgi:thymidine phosphorylase